MATADTAHQSFRDLNLVSSQSNPMQGAQGYFLSQGLQYEGECRAPSKDGPNLESDNFRREAPGLRSKDGFTTGPVNYFLTYPEAGGVFAVEASVSHLNTEYTTGSVHLPTSRLVVYSQARLLVHISIQNIRLVLSTTSLPTSRLVVYSRAKLLVLRSDLGSTEGTVDSNP